MLQPEGLPCEAKLTDIVYLEVQGSYKGSLDVEYYFVCGIGYILLEVQGSYNQAITVVINHLRAT